MKITTIPRHLNRIYDIPTGWSGMIINGFEPDIEAVEGWVSENFDKDQVATKTKYGGGSRQREMKFNHILAFDDDSGSVALKMRFS